MKNFDKSAIPFIIFIGIGFAIIAAIYLFFGPILLVDSVQETVFYLSERKNTAHIQATVTDIDETSAVDSGVAYDVYVSYEYDNILYKNIYWRTVGAETEYSPGEVVAVNIFCSKPNDIADLGFGPYIGWIFPLVVTLCPLLVLIAYLPNLHLSKSKKRSS